MLFDFHFLAETGSLATSSLIKSVNSPSEETSYMEILFAYNHASVVYIKLQLTGLLSKYSSISAWSFSCISGFRASR